MIVSPLAPGDRTAAIALWEASGLTRPWNDPVADFDRALAGPASTVLGTWRDGALSGTVMVGEDGHRGWLYYLAVDHDRRRAGIGRALVSAAEEWLAARGCPKVQLMVRAGNDAAMLFYDRLGYGTDAVTVRSRRLDGTSPTLGG